MRTTTVIIGAGHAGLAMSRRLADRSIDHVVLERGEVANSWKTERWDSLRLLTPKWQSRLPGYVYRGQDPHGFRTMPETIRFLEHYAHVIAAPVREHTEVKLVSRTESGYLVHTSEGQWQCEYVVLASGACNVASVPALASELPGEIQQITTAQYRNPAQIEPGGVLVVGASASGTQIADELQRAGHSVTLAVGEHVRVPREYRGRDIKWWMDAAGVLDQHYKEVDDLGRARNVPSLQLGGSEDRRNFDLNALTDRGVRLVGRLAAVRAEEGLFSGSLPNHCALADLKMNRLLDGIDQWAREQGFDNQADTRHGLEPTRVPDSPPLRINWQAHDIRTVVWATGYRPDHSWLQVPVFDRKGKVMHDGGITTAPGLYIMGLPFLRRRKSSLIDGAAADSEDICEHLAATLDGATICRPGTVSRHNYIGTKGEIHAALAK